MYKPNGEEPMTKQEEMRRRETAAERSAMRSSIDPAAESLRSAFYSAMYRSVSEQTRTLVGESQ